VVPSRIGYWHHTIVCLSVTECIVLRVGVGGLKLYRRVSRRLWGDFLLTSWDTFAVGCIVQPLHTAKNWTAQISMSGIAVGSMVTWPWLFQTWRFGSAVTPYVICSTISLLSNCYIYCLLALVVELEIWQDLVICVCVLGNRAWRHWLSYLSDAALWHQLQQHWSSTSQLFSATQWPTTTSTPHYGSQMYKGSFHPARSKLSSWEEAPVSSVIVFTLVPCHLPAGNGRVHRWTNSACMSGLPIKLSHQTHQHLT